MNDTLFNIIMALIPVCGLVITGFVIPYLKVSIGDKQLAYIAQWVKKAVEAKWITESEYKTITGKSYK